MGSLWNALTGRTVDVVTHEIVAPTFAVDSESIAPGFYGLASYEDPIAPAARISRREAIQVPAVKGVRDLISGALGSLPIDVIDTERVTHFSDLLSQPERHEPRSVTMTRTVEDLLFEGVAYWRVTTRYFDGYPRFVEHLQPGRVAVGTDNVPYVDGRPSSWDEVIRFRSPNDGLLIAAARAIRTCLRLDAASAMYADEPLPRGYFSPAENVDPAEMQEHENSGYVDEVLADWKAARNRGATGYVGSALKYNPVQFTPEQLQLADARQHAVLEIARAAGVDPEELGVSTTSRTYANQFDRRKHFIDFTLGGYRAAIEGRLSMNDVTKRGYVVRFNLSAFLRSDDKTRMETYRLALDVGAITPDEIRDLEDKPPLPAGARPEPTPAPEVPVSASQFSANEAQPISFEFSADVSVDFDRRTIKGLALPYGVPGISNGRRIQFSRGSLDTTQPTRIKVLVGHDWKQAVGHAIEFDDSDTGLTTTLKIARGAEGDRALQMAEDGVWDGLSVGIHPHQPFTFQERDGVLHATGARLAEVSLTPMPAFADARVTSVTASAVDTTEKEHVMTDQQVTPEAAEPVSFDGIAQAIRDGFSGLSAPGPETVTPTATFEVNEPLPYRFDGVAGQHSFADDIRDAQQGDPSAAKRLDEWTDLAFAVTTANTATLNPNQNRPDLYVPNLTYSRPLFEAVTTGTISDRTAFTFPKMGSATGLVGPHTEGVEPTPGSMSTGSQTVQPSALSGKIEITREVIDQGGNPQVDQLLNAEFVNAWYEAIEGRIAAALQATTTPELNLAGATGGALIDALTNYYAGLQYVRGGNRFTGLALDGTLFGALVAAADTTGRKLLPVLSPQNAQGSVTGAFDRIQIGNQVGRAAWGLGSGNAARSYSFVPSSVYVWTSTPQRPRFEYQIKSVDYGIWGYCATAILRDSDVKPIDYTTADA